MNITINKTTKTSGNPVMLSSTKQDNLTESHITVKDYLLNGAIVDFTKNSNGEDVYIINGVKDLEVSTKGYIIDKGEVKYPKQSNDTVYISRREGWAAVNIAFKTLVTMLNGYVPKGGLVIEMKDEVNGWSPDNLILINKFTKQEVDFNHLERITSKDEMKYSSDVIRERSDTLDGKILYTRKETVVEYKTEDGAMFPSLELAQWHQGIVDEGKALAQMVMDYNGGYALAEKMFQEKVTYNKERPYVNFRDVLENNNGIQEVVTKEVVKFNHFKIAGKPEWAYLFNDNSYTQEVADMIVEKLEQAQQMYKELEKLAKQTV